MNPDANELSANESSTNQSPTNQSPANELSARSFTTDHSDASHSPSTLSPTRPPSENTAAMNPAANQSSTNQSSINELSANQSPANDCRLPPSPTAPVALWSRWKRRLLGPGLPLLFGLCAFAVLALFSGHRFFHQSKAQHFIWQAQAFLEGSLALVEDPPNLEDYVRQGDRFLVSFPAFPALAMLPGVALFGYRFNDTSFTVAIAALALALFLAFLRRLRRDGDSDLSDAASLIWAALLGFGTLFFSCAIRGEVWFTAEIMGVALTALYLLTAHRARHPLLAGLFYSMATLTRTPLVFAAAFFAIELFFPDGQWRLSALKTDARAKLQKLALFIVGALPLALAHMAFNFARFGSVSEFGHRFFWNNRVNADIAQYGLFDLHYLPRNISAAFLKLPTISFDPFHIGYDPHGMSLFLTTPLLILLFFPKQKPRLLLALAVTAAAIALPGLFYQNDGYMQFGFRFSLDYTPYLIALLALGGWSIKNKFVLCLAAIGVAVNTWGAIVFKGFSW